MKILVFNCGSSSLKFELLDVDAIGERRRTLVRGEIEEIGAKSRLLVMHGRSRRAEPLAVSDHAGAATAVLDRLEASGGEADAGGEPLATGLDAVAHRVVHGGTRITTAALATDDVMAAIESASQFAPLHNPPALAVIRTVASRLPGVPAIAIADTAFHATIPACARLYALPAELAERYGLRRFGFHGVGHAWMAEQCARLRGTKLSQLNLITLQLGAGCSATAIRAGVSVDTSMGLTPLEGLMMGTRSGDLDPAIPLLLAKNERLDPEAVERILNHESGLLGVSGLSADLREIEAAALREPRGAAALALEMFCYRVRKYIGAYLAVLGRTDAIVFGGGIGEHSALVRARVLEGLDGLGILLDRRANLSAQGRGAKISQAHSRPAVYVIPLDEELYMAREAARLVAASGLAS